MIEAALAKHFAAETTTKISTKRARRSPPSSRANSPNSKLPKVEKSFYLHRSPSSSPPSSPTLPMRNSRSSSVEIVRTHTLLKLSPNNPFAPAYNQNPQNDDLRKAASGWEESDRQRYHTPASRKSNFRYKRTSSERDDKSIRSNLFHSRRARNTSRSPSRARSYSSSSRNTRREDKRDRRNYYQTNEQEVNVDWGKSRPPRRN